MTSTQIERKHLVFYGSDEYVSSVPLKNIIGDTQRKNNCLLATHMDNRPLSLDHGFPVRALIPGIVGARSVKWLNKVEIKNSESNTCWNQYFYRVNGKSCMEIPLNSLITDTKIINNILYLKGVAYGDGEVINEIEVSFDKCINWRKIDLSKNYTLKNDSLNNIYSWTRWEYQVSLSDINHDSDINNEIEIWCRAVSNKRKQHFDSRISDLDKQSNENYLYNGWHQVKILK